MILHPKLNKKNPKINRVIILLFLFTGFSQVELFSYRPTDFILIIAFFLLVIKDKFTAVPAFVFFVFSFLYAYIMGGFNGPQTLITKIIVFSILFKLVQLLSVCSLFEIKKYLIYFNYSMFLSNFIALYCFFNPEFKEIVADSSYSGLRMKGFFTQPNGYSYVLLLNAPIALYFLINKKNIFNIFNVIITIICMIMAQSRGAILSLIIGLIIVYLIYLLRSGEFKKYIFPITSIITILYLGLFILPTTLHNQFGINLSRLNKVSSNHERNINDMKVKNIDEDRFYLAKAGIETISEYPFGLGFRDNYHMIIGELTGVYLIPHNYFLGIILRYGLILGLCWLIIIALLLTKGIVLLFKEKISPHHLFFHLTSMMIMIFLFYFSHSSDWSYFFFLIAFYIALLRNKKLRNSK